MAKVLQRLIEPPRACTYLPEEQAAHEFRVQIDVTPDELEAMLERGFRRFGPVYFRPSCANCTECVSLRIPTATFRPTKSQRRAARHTERLRRVVRTPRVDEERLRLYRAWHATRERDRGWAPTDIDPERYALDFAFPHPCVREVAFHDPNDGDRLVGIGICDETPRALSAIFFFWDPSYAPDSLGVGHVVRLVEDAKLRGLPHVYLGYRVLACASLAYKSRYEPHELLVGRPDDGDVPTWRLRSP